MKIRNDISTIEDIKVLVDSFYSKIQKDELLSFIFKEKAQISRSLHLEKMYRFWQIILLGEHAYIGSSFPLHPQLPISKFHFDLWLYYFLETLNENFSGKKSDEAYNRVQKTMHIFTTKMKSKSRNLL